MSAGGTAFNGGGPMGAAAAVTLDSFQQQQQQQQDSDCAIVAGEEDEVMEVTPEVHRDFFTGKHFLLTGNDDRDRSDEGMTRLVLSFWTCKLCNGHSPDI